MSQRNNGEQVMVSKPKEVWMLKYYPRKENDPPWIKTDMTFDFPEQAETWIRVFFGAHRSSRYVRRIEAVLFREVMQEIE